jgi:hypothetical protein
MRRIFISIDKAVTVNTIAAVTKRNPILNAPIPFFIDFTIEWSEEISI